MIILTIRTDKPESEIGIFDGHNKLEYVAWSAHRELAETIHIKIREILEKQELALNDLEGIVVYKGPGSFTGLRIGVTVANTLASSLGIPITGEATDAWIENGIQKLIEGETEQIIQPEYGAPPHITQQKR